MTAKFRVSRSWVNRLVQRRRESGEVTARKQTVFKKQALAGQGNRLRALVGAARSDLAELRDALQSPASLSSVWRALDRLDITVKKTVHGRTAPADVAAERQRWRDCLRDLRTTSFSMNAALPPI